MTLIESIVASLLFTLSVLSPSENISYEETIDSNNVPLVFVVPQEEFQMTVCGCFCGVAGSYLGEGEINGVEGRYILMGGPGGRIPYSPYWFSHLYHELHHYRQDLEGRLNNKENPNKRVELEKEAYDVQNLYNEMVGIGTIDLNVGSQNSVTWSSGKPACLDNSEPIPLEQRKSFKDLILQYHGGMMEIYRNR